MTKKACMVLPGELSGTCVAPPSKSYGVRAVAAALLAGAYTRIRPAHASEDMQAALGVLGALGASVRHEEKEICIDSRHAFLNGEKRRSGSAAERMKSEHTDASCEKKGFVKSAMDGESDAAHHRKIVCGESALTMRLFAPIVALSADPVVLHARGTLARRLQTPFANILPALGVSFESAGGYPPLRVQGPLKYHLCHRHLRLGHIWSSQFLTGLLFAYAGAGAEDVTITLSHPVSRPYVALSLEVLRRFGVEVRCQEDIHFSFEKKATLKSPGVFDVEGDWSAAAYLLVAAALRGHIRVEGLRMDSLQGDRYILEVLSQAGVTLHLHPEAVEARKAPLRAFRASLSNRPDLFPAVAVLAAFAQGTSYLEGVDRLKHKESARGQAIAAILHKVGVPVQVHGNVLCVQGVGALRDVEALSCYADHRIAMMNALLALCSPRGYVLEGAEAVAKSFPEFFGYLHMCSRGHA